MWTAPNGIIFIHLKNRFISFESPYNYANNNELHEFSEFACGFGI